MLEAELLSECADDAIVSSAAFCGPATLDVFGGTTTAERWDTEAVRGDTDIAKHRAHGMLVASRARCQEVSGRPGQVHAGSSGCSQGQPRGPPALGIQTRPTCCFDFYICGPRGPWGGGPGRSCHCDAVRSGSTLVKEMRAYFNLSKDLTNMCSTFMTAESKSRE